LFDLDTFLVDLAACAGEHDPRAAAHGVLERALARPGEVADALMPTAGGITLLHRQPDFTVISVAWAPKMQLMPHDHRMWALISIYAGTEDNRFYRRDEGELVDSGERRVETGEICSLGVQTIHSVRNPTDRLTGAIHVYGGDFVEQPRSQWGPGDRIERTYDPAEVERQFRAANAAAGLTP
jgi:predicted metal-dependent enzyme (double-stranded beta helix superfamily)